MRSKFFEMTNDELNAKVTELKAELFNLRFKHAAKQISNPMVLVECKRNIARAKTVLRLREMGKDVEPVKVVKKTRTKKAKAE